MNILAVHNSYQQPGGEDQVFALETALLERHGHRVIRYQVHNNQMPGYSPSLAGRVIWNRESYRRARAAIRDERIELVHVHNTFPLISPSVYYAAKREGVPVVQTLHNYRLLCVNATLFRDGHPCTDCVAKPLPWPGVLRACYRGSRLASGGVSGIVTAHRLLRTWTRKVDVYIALSQAARDLFVAGGLPPEKILVKPNFVDPDPGAGEGKGGYALFVGRLVTEKGIATLLQAWRRLGRRIPLEVIGDGPMAGEVDEAARTIPGIRRHPWLPREKVFEWMKNASMLVVPSVWHETFGLIVVEAFAMGLPVVASRLGSLATLVRHDGTGRHFTAGDPGDLADQVEWLLDRPDALASMRRRARLEFEAGYTGDHNYARLLDIYRHAAKCNLERRNLRRPACEELAGLGG